MAGNPSFGLLFALILIPCGIFSQGIFIDTTSKLVPVVSVKVSPDDTARLSGMITERSIQKVLGLHLVKNGKPLPVAVSGRYFLDDLTLTFHPVSMIGEGSEFVVTYIRDGDTLTENLTTPASVIPPSPLSEISRIFPAAGKIPCNELFFHIRFTHPMFPDRLAWQAVKMLDADKSEIPKMWRERSYWLDSNRVLVLMIHPGRVKRGIGLDVPFIEGSSYTFLVAGKLMDAYGRHIRINSEVVFTAVADDYEIPKVNHKEMLIPRSGTLDPLSVQFTEAMDYAGIIDGVTITGNDGKQIAGAFQPHLNEAAFEFFPEQKWTPGKYSITYGKVVADLAGNRLNRRFEMSSAEEVLRDEPIIWEFKIE